MSLRLSSRELEQLTRALQLLVSPLDHATPDQWRSAVNGALRALLGADSAGFLLPVGGRLTLHSDEHDPAALARYPDYPPPRLSDGREVFEEVLRLGVATGPMAYGSEYEGYLRSAYYHEYAGANGAHDPLSMAVPLEGAGAGGLAMLQFWHAQPGGVQFGAREVALLRMLLPAFRAGVETQLRWGEHRRGLLNALESLGQAVLVCDVSGRVLHQTAALDALLEADAEAAVLSGELRAAMHAVRRAVVIPVAFRSAAPLAPVVVEVRTRAACYAVRASVSAHAGAGADPMILVALERRTPAAVPDEALQEAFGLTRAETRVARLIARGMGNAELAAELCISPHTARRHTERVLLKLGVRSRAEVGPRMLWPQPVGR